jgi:anti-sigma factor RsiW
MPVEPTRTTAPMECAELERSIDAYLDGEFDPQERCDALAHLASCSPCRTLADRQALLRDGMRACLRRALGPDAEAARAPAALRLRIVAALAEERPPWWRRVGGPIPLALGVLALCAACAAFVATRSHDDLLVEEAVRRHVRNLPLEVTVDRATPEQVHAWFTGKLDFNPRPPRFAAPDVQLVGGRLSHISDRPAAYMRYHLPRGHVGLFIVEDRQRRFGDSGRTVRVGPEEVHLVSARGYNLAVWRHDEILYSLVGDLDEHQLARLVASTAADRR